VENGQLLSDGAGTGALQMRQYLDAARRHWLMILLPAIVVSVATFVVALRLPNIYRAETVVMVDPQQVPRDIVASTVTASISDRLSTIQQQVLSPTRLQKLIESTNLYPDLRGKRSNEELIRMMQGSISVELVGSGGSRTSAFEIVYHGRNPNEAAQIANQLASMFIDENLKVREGQAEGTAEFLQNELQRTKQELERKEAEVQGIKTRNVMDLPDSKQYHIEVLGNLRSQLQASQDRINRAQQEKFYLQSMMNNSHPTVDLDSGGGGSAASPHQSELQKLEARFAELEARYGPGHPDVRRVRKDLEDLKKRDAAEAAGAPKQVESKQASIEALASEARKNPVIEAQLAKLEQDIQDQTKLQAQMQEQINFHVAKLEQIPIFEQQIASLMRDYDTLRAHYTSLLDKKLSAEMGRALEDHQKAERFVVLDKATPPAKPYAPNRALICLAGLFGGLLGGIALAAFLEISDESVRSEIDVTSIAGKPVLAGIPPLLFKEEARRVRLRAIAAVLAATAGAVVVGFAISKISSLVS
jgi:succinoglycan biosynthesis transport protein ExoP